MTEAKIFDDLPLLDETPAAGDFLEMVDVSDDTEDATGTNKRVTVANLLGGVDSKFDILVVNQGNTPVTPGLGDAGKAVIIDVEGQVGAVDFVVPADATVDFPVGSGFWIAARRIDSPAQLSVPSGVTVYISISSGIVAAGPTTISVADGRWLIKTAANTWQF